MRVRRRASIFALLALGLGCVALSLVAYFALPTSDDRSTFQPLTADTLSIFDETYKSAAAEGAQWVSDPNEIAARLTCMSEECGQRIVSRTSPPSGLTTVIVEYPNAMDDSIKATRYRVDLAPQGGSGSWRIDWAGWKQQCRRVGGLEAILSGYYGWHTKLCP